MPEGAVSVDMEQYAAEAAGWIRRQVAEAGARGAVFGLSGGIDSAVVAGLCRRALGERCLALILPCESRPEDAEDAALVAHTFGIAVHTVDLTPVYRSLLAAVPPVDAGEERLELARANLKPRLRMLTLYYHANALNYLVVGTGNRSELAVGYFTKHGDGGVDLLPIGSLLKREVRALARHLGVPERIIARPPSAGLWSGQTDEAELGLTYDVLDAVLAGESRDAAAAARIESLHRASAHKRALPPIGPALTP